MNKRQSLRRRSCSTVVAALSFFALFQLILNLVIHKRHIELRDPEYGYKLAALRSRIRQDPNRPLVLILGSSRAALGVVPSELHLTSSDSGPLVFNMALSGSGPLLELICLKRILAEGIHPRWVLIEVLPTTLSEEPIWSDSAFLDPCRLSVDELTLLRQHYEFPDQLHWGWIESHGLPWYTHRFFLMSHFAPRWLPDDVRTDSWRTMDLDGFRYGVFRFMEDEHLHQCRIVLAEKQYAAALQRFAISDRSDRALHALLDLCHDQQIPALLYLMPEGEWFQSWYPPATQSAIRDYLEKVTKEYGVPIVDARTWHHEVDFVDSHHLLEPAAWAFSKRLGGEINQMGFLDKDSHKISPARHSLVRTGAQSNRVDTLQD